MSSATSSKKARTSLLTSTWSSRLFENSDVSTSTWTTLPLGANFVRSPVDLSLKRAPSAMRQSHSYIALVLAKCPCMPSMPRKPGASVGTPETPMSEHPMGAPIFFAKSMISCDAPDQTAPPPKYTNGLRDLFIAVAAASSSSLDARGGSSAGSGPASCQSIIARWTSAGMSTRTGPRLPEFASRNASRSTSCRRFASRTK